MNRDDFMDQLEKLLQNISSTEREEALQYYEGYFDDAGKENEQEVIEALGNPARVAENIKRDLLGNSGLDGAARKVRASDRILVEYGKENQEASGGSPEGVGGTGSGQGDSPETGWGSGSSSMPGSGESRAAAGTGTESRTALGGSGESRAAAGTGTESRAAVGTGTESRTALGGSGESRAAAGTGTESRAAAGFGSETGGCAVSGMFSSQDGAGVEPGPWLDGGSGQYDGSGWYSETGLAGGAGGVGGAGGGRSGKSGSGLPAWAVALVAVALVFTCPLILGFLGTLAGLLVSWFSIIVGLGVSAVALLVVFVVLVVVGLICMFADPWVGAALVGGGFLCGALGLLCLMGTVAMAGIATPAIFRGIKYLFGKRAKGRI